MRFLIKMAFWLALIAFFLPSPRSDDSAAANVDYFGAFLGAQEALGDVSGFCDRSPTACAAGEDIGAYVASRVGDGIAYAYHALNASGLPATGPDRPTVAAAAAPPTQPDPMATAAVGAENVRRLAGLPPFVKVLAPAAANADSPLPAAEPTPAVAVPTPAPRA